MDDEVEWAKSVARLFRGMYEDSVIAAAEESLPLTPDATQVPMPDTCHPAYESNAEFVRSWNRNDPVRVPRPYRPSFSFADEALSPCRGAVALSGADAPQVHGRRAVRG